MIIWELVRDIVKQLERNSQVTLASLQEKVTISIAELTDRVQAAEKAVMSLSETFTTLTEGQIRLGNRQTTLNQIILHHLICQEMADVQINATKGTAQVSINTMKGTVDISTNTEGPISLNHIAEVKASSLAPTYLAPKPVGATWARLRSPTPYTVGSRKSPWLIQPPLGKSSG